MLTALVWWAMTVIRGWSEVGALERLDRFAKLSYILAAALMVFVIALACFVSIRAIKVGKDGIEATGSGGDGNASATLSTDAGSATISLPTAAPAPVDAPPPDN